MLRQKTSGEAMSEPSGTQEHSAGEAFVIVKAAPRPSKQHGITVCCAALDRESRWVRLYPVSFRYLEQRQRFARWDRIKYKWRNPRVAADARSESKRVADHSIEIVGTLPQSQRQPLLNRCLVSSLRQEAAAGRSLALLKIEVLDFWFEKRADDEVTRERQNRAVLRSQGDMFSLASEVPADTIPYRFMYRYRDADGPHTGTCQDWESEATFLKRRQELGSEKSALEWMQHKFGVEWPSKGIALAMGTHRYHPDQWLINGIIRLDESAQGRLL